MRSFHAPRPRGVKTAVLKIACGKSKRIDERQQWRRSSRCVQAFKCYRTPHMGTLARDAKRRTLHSRAIIGM